MWPSDVLGGTIASKLVLLPRRCGWLRVGRPTDDGWSSQSLMGTSTTTSY
jgi:hypothetical protein